MEISQEKQATVECSALRLIKCSTENVYLFALKASDLLRVASLSRIKRDNNQEIVGYQRGAVRSHIQDIQEYLNQETVLFPNPIILGFSYLQFNPNEKNVAGDVSFGSLSLPVLRKDADVTGWVVDGQQRALALTQSENPNLAVPVSAFEAATLDRQRDQFLRINNVRPLPRALITELLPTLPGNPPRRYKSRTLPSRLCERLNTDSDSPFYQLIKRPSTPKDERGKRVVTDTSLIDSIEKSLKSPSGALFAYQNLATGEAEIETLCKMLKGYWKGIKQVFPKAWGYPPRQSRLMHGVGIKALGRLMDHVLRSIPAGSEIPTAVASEVKKVESACAWTEGRWEGLGNIPWNALQNTPRHVRLLSDHLIATYRGH